MKPLLLTPGEPAGIGPELAVRLARAGRAGGIVAVADPDLLMETAHGLGMPLKVNEYREGERVPAAAGRLTVMPVRLARPAVPGRIDPENARYVLATLDAAIEACLDGKAAGLVTGPVHKGVINEAGITFTGHTGYLAERCNARPVMMLTAGSLRVALVTIHLPLAEVPAAVTGQRLEHTLTTLATALTGDFGIDNPRIAVLGLNPHAGEGGHLGREEIEVFEPVLERLRDKGLALEGPLPADTAFTPANLERFDAVAAMYHDQGLPVLKHAGFGRAVNVTLGLPIVRTSVDHGTALNIAGQGRADTGSLAAALEMAADIARHRAGRT